MEELKYMNKQEAAAFVSKDKESAWLNPAAMSALKKAVHNGEQTVVIGGARYSITYGFRRHYEASGTAEESVRLNPMDGRFVPMAYVNMAKIRAAQ